ncbi:MAG: phytanoyl-CoA dioxygenase family protein [Parvibaculum sp.]|nr:phytanoyl-CoA dioxygenase family protein [Parvibaculum sp.]
MKPISYLAAPLWLVQLASGAKSFRANPLIGSVRLNRRGLHAARVRLARAMAERRRQRLAASVGPAEIADYTRDGYVVCRNFLPPELFAEIRRDLNANPLPSWERREGATVTRRASLDRPDIAGRPALAAFLDDNRLFDLMRFVAGCGGEPLVHVQTVIAEPDPSRPDPQNTLHMDTFHSTAKAWLYLQDVGPEDGPLLYVPGSHRMTEERYAWERDLSLRAAQHADPEIAAGSFRVDRETALQLGYREPVAMTVPANTLVVADTHGFHARCASTRPTHRSELYATLRRNPFLPVTGLHFHALPGIRGRLSTRQAQLDGMLKRFGIGGPWIDVAPTCLADPPSI